MSKDYVEVSVVANSETEEGLCDFLFSEGALGLVTEDVPGEPFRVRVRASFVGGSPLPLLSERLRRYREELAALGLGDPDAPVEVEHIPAEDWEQSWKEHFKPIPVGRRLVIAPPWIQGPLPGDRIPIRINPGMAFGTGQDPTTRMCLEALEACMDQWGAGQGPVVLDLGTGTGILAIAAASLGAQRVIALDNDPEAYSAARENGALNACGDRVRVLLGGVEALEPPLRFDVILANLDTGALCPHLSTLSPLLAPEGRLIAGGILVEEEGSVTHAARTSGLRPLERRVEGDSLCLTLAAA